MARTLIRFAPIVPAERNFPLNRYTRFETLITAYMTGPLERMLKRDFEATVENWSGPPNFVSKFTRPRGTSWQLVIDPKGRGTLKWTRVSGGVKAHDIVPRGPWNLRFQRNYTPHTRPKGKWGGPGSRSGNTVVTPMVSARRWGGIKPREFSLVIKEKREKKIHAEFEAILKAAFH